jgi:hypothetical protein
MCGYLREIINGRYDDVEGKERKGKERKGKERKARHLSEELMLILIRRTA